MTGTTTRVVDDVVPATGAPPATGPLHRLRTMLAPLFPTVERPRRLSPGWVVAGTAFVLVGALLSLFRVAAAGPFNSVFAEDGAHYLADALSRGTIDALIRPLNGYLVIFPRLLAEPTTLLPPEWGPALLSIEAALVIAGLALVVYVASGAHLRDPAARLLVAAPLIVSPIGENMAATIANNVATLQFYFTYAMFWALLWSPVSRWGRATQAAVIILGTMTTALTLMLLPLALLRLFMKRDASSWVYVVSIFGMGALNVIALISGYAPRMGLSHPNTSLAWGLEQYLREGVPLPLWGYEWGSPLLYGQSMLLWAVPWSVLIVGVGVVLLFRLTRPAVLLALAAFAHGIVFFLVQVMLHGSPEKRYFFAPSLLLIAGLVALFIPRDADAAWWRVTATRMPVLLLAAVTVIAGLNDYRQATGRTNAVAWRPLVAEGRELCKDPANGAVALYPMANGRIERYPVGTNIPSYPDYGFPVWIPCSKLR